MLSYRQESALVEQPSVKEATVRCRAIEETDLERIVPLLASAFGDPNLPIGVRLYEAARKWLTITNKDPVSANTRGCEFWRTALRRLGNREVPPGYPRYGHLLTVDGQPVGLLLLIFARTVVGGETRIRCNLSSWCIDARYRAYGPLLVLRALKNKDVTYFNVTPSPATWPILEAQGFRPFCAGTFLSVPLLSRRLFSCTVDRIIPSLKSVEGLSRFEFELLRDHEAWGCLSFVCRFEGRAHPFVFAVPRRFGCIKYAYLIYSRSLEEFGWFARPLGAALARHGIFLVALGADGPLPGVAGTFRPNKPQYFKGPHSLPHGDVAFSERAIFGI